MNRLVVGLVFLVAFGIGCPRPTPVPVTPPRDADAGPYVPPIVHPSENTCQAACQAASTACSGQVDLATCQGICMALDVSYAARLAAAQDCPGVQAADPAAAPTDGRTPQRGR